MNQAAPTVTCKDIEGNEYSVSADKLTFRPATRAQDILDAYNFLNLQKFSVTNS